MTAKEIKKAVTDEQRIQLIDRMRGLEGKVEIGVVPFELAMEGIQQIADGNFMVNSNDPAEPYRGIKGLTIIGPLEYERVAMGKEGQNYLDLKPGWCPRFPVPLSVKEIRARVKLARQWDTNATLMLDIPKIGVFPTSLENQSFWFAVPHNGSDPGVIHPDIFWSNWFMGQGHDWAKKPSVLEPTWKIKYELPNWTIRKTWEEQKSVIADHHLINATATSDALYLNLTLALTGKRLRLNTWARTSTISDRCPLGVGSDGDGVRVNQRRSPASVGDGLGAAVEEVLGPLTAVA